MPQNEKQEPVSKEVIETLNLLMDSDEFNSFRLVGGTSLSIQLEHRQSIDIDLFTDAEYGTIDFDVIDLFLRTNFNYTDPNDFSKDAFGRMYFIGKSAANAIKLDLFYTDPFIREPIIIDKLRLAGIEDISAMKLELIAGGGRKKDFWDIAGILDRYPFSDLMGFYAERYPYFDINSVITGLTNFKYAEEMDDPICLKNKVWEIIKLDIREAVEEYIKT